MGATRTKISAPIFHLGTAIVQLITILIFSMAEYYLHIQRGIWICIIIFIESILITTIYNKNTIGKAQTKLFNYLLNLIISTIVAGTALLYPENIWYNLITSPIFIRVVGD